MKFKPNPLLCWEKRKFFQHLQTCNMEELRSLQIPVNLVGEERYTLCNTELIQ